jgi:putative oxidoreductase
MKYIPLAARICLSLVFLNAAINHAKGFAGFVEYIGTVLPLAPLLAVGTIAFQCLGVLSLILGYKVRIGALLLIVFLVPTSIFFHNFLAQPDQLGNFLKNVGLIGGLLMVLYTGAGAASLDALLHSRITES